MGWGLQVAVAAGWCAAAAAQSTSTALTLSGWPAGPRTERTTRPAAAAIRFTAPASVTLEAAHLVWRRNAGGCSLSLQADDDGAPGALLASGPVPAGNGWRSTPLGAPLVAGRRYHLVPSCDDSVSRLAYVLESERDAVQAGVWTVEDLRTVVRPRRAPASPLFALALADGSWWGQPYRGRRRALRLCGGNEVSTTFVPTQALTLDGVDVPTGIGGRLAPAGYTLDTVDGSGRTSSAPTTLTPGARYVLRLHAGGLCQRLNGLVTDLALGPPLAAVTAFEGLGVQSSADGGSTWTHEPAITVGARLRWKDHKTTTTTTTPATTTSTSTTTTRPTTTSTLTTTTTRAPTTTQTGTTSTTTSTTLATRTYRAPYADGYLGFYDSNTIPLWPQRMILMLGEANAQGPLIANAKQVAAAAGNGDARFIFYFSLTDMDSRCSCFDQSFYDSLKTTHPEWILKDASGNQVTTSNGIGRLFAADIGNLAYIDAWANWAFAAMTRYGWDGTFADNIFRGNFSSWSAYPINPRTGSTYTAAQYRQDMLTALRRLRSLYDARGKLLIGNHSSAWDPSTFADPVVQQEITTMHGVEMEDCVFDFNGNRQSESSWIAQLRYLDFANQNGVRSICSGPSGVMGDTTKRWYVLASYLLTKEGFSSVAEINSVSTWWSGLDYSLGAPVGRFYCLDPAAGLARTSSCPSTGKIYARDWENGRVLVNPTSATTVTVPLDTTMLWQGTPVASVTLAPGSGVVLLNP